MLFGQEMLGAARYERFAIEHLPNGRCGKTFSKEFGPSQNVLKKWAEQGTHPIVATQGLWRGGAHDYSGQATLKEGLKELEKFILIAQAHPAQLFEFSIFCESRLKRSQLENVFKEQWKLVKDIQNIVLVNTPMQGGDLLFAEDFGIAPNRIANEIHGTWNPQTNGFAPYMWACDGLPAQDCDIEKYKDRHRNATVIWLWMQQYNCKAKPTDTTPISQRTVKPIEKQVTGLEYLIPERGRTKTNGNDIFKLMADQHGDKPTGREGKPVTITKTNADRLEYRDQQGNLVHTAKRAGNYTDGRPMYRAELWGFEIQDKIAAGVSKILNIIAVKGNKKTKIAEINPAYRDGTFRLSTMKRLWKGFLSIFKGKDNDEFILDDEKEISPDWV